MHTSPDLKYSIRLPALALSPLLSITAFLRSRSLSPLNSSLEPLFDGNLICCSFEPRRDLRPPTGPVAIRLELSVMAPWFDVAVIDQERHEDKRDGDAEGQSICKAVIAVIRGDGDRGLRRRRRGP